ncbi:MAG TPA: fasciclin domain-containing protein [Alphaproteobacteria bacterium]|nr:hypothetical protein [Rhodospirillaceae bacterium]HRJ13056.1 fasciclin domain-containing protein [Alphaproteobacteria bacterium]
MKLSALLMTAALGLVISGAAIAAETPSAPAATTTTQSRQTTTMSSMPAEPASAATATTTTTTTTARTTTTEIQGKTVLDLAASDSQFSTLAKAIKAAGLETTLNGNGPLTIFAPTNAAFDKLGQQKLNELMKPENKAQLTQILTYHVVPQALPQNAGAQPQPTAFETAEGQSLMLKKQQDGNLQIQNAKALNSTPMNASNGQVIAIDTVLMPEAESKMMGKPSLITPAKPPTPANSARTATPSTSQTAPAAPAASSAQ